MSGYQAVALENVALLAEGVDRNPRGVVGEQLLHVSPSSRRAWIEIRNQARPATRETSPSSRRAWIEILCGTGEDINVAVALLAEGVDRNAMLALMPLICARSPSSRRAWIEIHCGCEISTSWDYVALLAEGVDRNIFQIDRIESAIKSPSSRRAWIEIFSQLSSPSTSSVALLAEGVDRNTSFQWFLSIPKNGRPPRGGRG